MISVNYMTVFAGTFIVFYLGFLLGAVAEFIRQAELKAKARAVIESMMEEELPSFEPEPMRGE